MPQYPDGTRIHVAEWNRLLEAIPSSYTLWLDGTTYRAESNVSGGTDYSNADFPTVFQQAVDALPTEGGTIHLKGNIFEGYVELDRDGIILEGEGSWSDIPAGIPDNSPTVLHGSVIKVTTADKDGIKIVGQRHGIQIRNLGVWFTQATTGHGITTDTTETYTLTHFVIENIKVLNCDKSHYAIQLVNFLHGNVRAIMAWGGPLIKLYANKANFHQGNSLFDNLYGYIKYDLNPVVEHEGPYPIFIRNNDALADVMTGLLEMRRIQINNPTGCTDPDYYTGYIGDLRYSTLTDWDLEGSNLQSQTLRVGSCQHVTFPNLFMWEMAPGVAYLTVANNNKYLTFIGCYLEKLLDSTTSDEYVNCEIVGTIHSATVAKFDNLIGNSGVATILIGTPSITPTARFIGPNDYVALTIINAGALATGEELKVDTINRAPVNTFVVNCLDEGNASAAITFYWEIRHVPA
jgi:hypothetical protein